jgi:hypothetical protein
MAKVKEVDYDDFEDAFKKCSRPRQGTNIRTPIGRTSFMWVQKPKANKKDPTKKPQYEVTLLIPPGFSLTLLKKEVERVVDEKWGEKRPRGLKLPFSDAGEYEYEGYEKGWTRLRASTTQAPGILDGEEDNAKITEEDSTAVYSGRWAIISVRPYAYDVDGSRGVSLGLANIRLMNHDTPLGGGRSSAASDFDIDEEYEDMKKGKRSAFDDEDEDDAPRKPVKKRRPVEDDDEDEVPVKKKRRVVEDDEDEEPPVRKKKRRVVEDDDEDFD